MPRDETCEKLGIPERLHQCGRPVIEQFLDSERLYRRVKQPCEDYALRVSLKRKDSSTNRSSLSIPDDVRWDESGEYHADCEVISFPVAPFASAKWSVPDEPSVSYNLTVFHDPRQCNYAHCDFRFYKNGSEVNAVTAKSVRLQIRDFLRPFIASGEAHGASA